MPQKQGDEQTISMIKHEESLLDGREVCADDHAIRVLVSEVDGPDSSAGAEIEDFFRTR